QGFTGLRQFMVPGRQRMPAGPLLEQGVALFQRTRITPPLRGEPRLDVEQAPIQKTPAWLAAAADQYMAAGLEGDHRQRSAQLAELGHILTIEPGAPILAAVTQAAATLTAVAGRILPLNKHFQR